jgi:predicted Zn-dependent peptidase
LRVVTEKQPLSRSLSIGVWVLSGTRHENKSELGISHFLEHLVFKGTRRRSALQIAKSLEMYGGDLNAYTTREYTCYHAFVLRDHWQEAIDVLCDLVTGMELRSKDFALEKSVILQEIAMSQDQVDELIYDVLLQKMFPKDPLGRPILGFEETISPLTMAQVKKHYRKAYSPNQLIVSASGNILHSDFVNALKKKFPKKQKARPKKVLHQLIKPQKAVYCEDRPTEQLHFLMGVPCASFRDKERFSAFIVNAFLGGGMTSKLYQTVREKRGLVYSIYSSLNTFADFGMLNVYAACEPKHMKEVFRLVEAQFEKLRKEGIRQADLDFFRRQVKGALLLGAEDVDNRMNSIAINEMVFGQYKPLDYIIGELESVTTRSVREFLDKYFLWDKASLVLMGAGAKEAESWLGQTKMGGIGQGKGVK